MKAYLIFYLLMITSLNVFSQFSEQQIISTEANCPRIVLTADIDNDGDVDVFSASQCDDKLAWYENEDGLGTFSGLKLIGLVDSVRRAVLTDIEMDGDIDIIGLNTFENAIILHTNNGNGVFEPGTFINQGLDAPYGATPTDIDNDGDMDLIIGSDSSGLNFIENLYDGATISFANPVAIDANLNVSRSVLAFDVDTDGDLDVVSTSSAGSVGQVIISWFENLDGQGDFSEKNIIATGVFTPQIIYSADINNDSYVDIVSCFSSDAKIVWYENIGGSGVFSNEKIIASNVVSASRVVAVDINNDDKIDVISASGNNNKIISWYENLDGIGDFGDEQIISTEIQGFTSIDSGDINGDGAADVLSSSILDDKIAWYRNEIFLDVEEQIFDTLLVYPNPSSDFINIQTSNHQQISKLECFDMQGNLFFVTKNSDSIDVSKLASGMYVLKITVDSKLLVRKFVKE